jgi:VWFA-related protein
MKQRRKWSVWACTLAGLAITLAAASLVGAQGNGDISIDQVDPSQHPAMTVLASVRDANGVPVPGLGAGVFEIVEDGRTSFPPETVSTQVNPDAVVSIALVVDLSGSMKGKPVEEAKAASVKLLDALLDVESDPDRVAFFGINRDVAPGDRSYDPAVEVPFTNDKNAVLNVVNFLAVEGNKPTPLYDALFRVIKFSAEQPGRKAIIVITDGIDKVSTLKADDPISEANRNNIPIFPISLSTNTVDDAFLERLAVRTGGQYRKAPGPEEFTAQFQEVLDQMKLQYKLDYQSRIDKNDQPHSVLVRVRTPQIEAFDEVKVDFNEPVPTPRAVSTSVGGESGVAAAQPTPAPAVGEEGGFLDDVKTFVEDNPLPAALIGLAILLFLVLIVLLIVWARRRKTAAPEAAGLGDTGWQVAPPGQTAPPTELDAGAARAAKSPALSTSSTAASAPTVGPGQAGYAPLPKPYSPPGPAAAGGGPVVAGAESTRLIQRAPKHTALLFDPKNTSRRFDVSATTDIGRTQGNTIVVNDPTVSRQHARIRLELAPADQTGGTDKFMLFDLGSANGTFVNGKRIDVPEALADGDTVRFGEVEFTFKQLT